MSIQILFKLSILAGFLWPNFSRQGGHFLITAGGTESEGDPHSLCWHKRECLPLLLGEKGSWVQHWASTSITLLEKQEFLVSVPLVVFIDTPWKKACYHLKGIKVLANCLSFSDTILAVAVMVRGWGLGWLITSWLTWKSRLCTQPFQEPVDTQRQFFCFTFSYGDWLEVLLKRFCLARLPLSLSYH